MLEKPCRIVAFGGDQFRHVLTSICDEKDHMPKKSDFSNFLRMWTLKFYSQNRGSPKAFFECFWDLNGRFFIFKRFESRFGRKIPKSALVL